MAKQQQEPKDEVVSEQQASSPRPKPQPPPFDIVRRRSPTGAKRARGGKKAAKGGKKR